MQNIIGQINWIDIFVIILLIRICYIAAELGLFIESFKLLGTLASIYLSLHYYKQLSDFTQNAIGPKDSPAYIFDLFSVIILAILSYLIFAILRKVFSKLVKVETLDNLNRWGALILGVIRGFLFASLIICIFIISDSEYLNKSVMNSYSGKRVFKIAPATYTLLWNNLFSKFMPQEELNEAIPELKELQAEKDKS